MLNRNFKTIMLGYFMSSQKTSYNYPEFRTQAVYNVDGNEGDYPPDNIDESDAQYIAATIINALNELTTNNVISRQSQNRLFMAVGTGTTEATAEDYTLENENTNITLKEVGLFYEAYYSSQWYINTIMLARENIDVTIPAGESKAITMEIG